MQQKFSQAHEELNRINGGIQNLLSLLLNCKNVEDQAKTLAEKISRLDMANPEYCAVRHDRKEWVWMVFFMLLPVATVAIDYVLLLKSFSILYPGMLGVFKFIFCVLLVTVETGTSMYLISKASVEDFPSRLTRWLPYVIIMVLISFSAVTIFYSVEGYDPQVDHESLTRHITGPILYQITLLVPSVLLHLILIRCSSEVHWYAAFCHYLVTRFSLVQKSKSTNVGPNNLHFKAFLLSVQKVVRRMNAFERTYPDVPADFGKNIPVDLAHAMGKVMGRPILQGSNTSQFTHSINFNDENDK
jgi:hypothetical protein